MEELSFYDLVAKKKFNSSSYHKEKRGKRNFAVAKSPYTKKDCWRALGK
jgi:hypothetical protein